jgi:plasmid stabilization system protein ParE
MLNVIWTDTAIEDYSNNIDYLEREWTEKVIEDFIEKSDAIIEKIALENLRFKPTDYENIFQVPVVKQISLFYKIDDFNVELLRFWNTYQNPSGLKLR